MFAVTTTSTCLDTLRQDTPRLRWDIRRYWWLRWTSCRCFQSRDFMFSSHACVYGSFFTSAVCRIYSFQNAWPHWSMFSDIRSSICSSSKNLISDLHLIMNGFVTSASFNSKSIRTWTSSCWRTATDWTRSPTTRTWTSSRPNRLTPLACVAKLRPRPPVRSSKFSLASFPSHPCTR